MVLLDPISTPYVLPTVQPWGAGGFAVCEEQWREPSFGLQGRPPKKSEKKTSIRNATWFLSGKNKKQYLDVHTYIEFLCVFVCIVTAWL